MAGSFTGRNCCAAVLAVVIIGLMVAASAGSWYTHQVEYSTSQSGDGSSIPDTSNSLLNATKTWYDLQGYKTEKSTRNANRGPTTVSEYLNYSARSGTLKHIFKTVQAFVLVALLSAIVMFILIVAFFFDRIRNKIVFALGMTVTRLLLVLFACLILLSVIIAFLVFIGVTQGFKDEYQSCVEGPCRKFVDSTDAEYQVSCAYLQQFGYTTTAGTQCKITEDRKWGPTEGWYITLGAIPVAAILLIVVVINKFPLPIDSEASSGEAL